MCPGTMPSPTAPGCTSGFPLRQNGSVPAGGGSKTGMAFNHYVHAKCAGVLILVLWPSHRVSLLLIPACKALPLGKQVEPQRPTLRQPMAGGLPQPQYRRGWIHQNFPGEKGQLWVVQALNCSLSMSHCCKSDRFKSRPAARTGNDKALMIRAHFRD